MSSNSGVPTDGRRSAQLPCATIERMEYIDTDSPLRLGRVIEARQLPDLLPALEPGEGFQIECDGKVVGAMISARDLELYLELLRDYEDKVDGEAAERILANSDRIPLEQLLEELGTTARS